MCVATSESGTRASNDDGLSELSAIADNLRSVRCHVRRHCRVPRVDQSFGKREVRVCSAVALFRDVGLVFPFNSLQATSGSAWIESCVVGSVSLGGGISQPVVLAKGTQVDAQPAAGGFHVDATVDGVLLHGIFVSSDRAAQPYDFMYARVLTLFRCNLNGADCELALVQDYEDGGFDGIVLSRRVMVRKPLQTDWRHPFGAVRLVDVASIHHVAILAPRHVGRELCRPEARCTADGSRLTQIGQDELNALLIKEQQHGHDVKRARPNSSKAPALVEKPTPVRPDRPATVDTLVYRVNLYSCGGK
jgi:hypothetical protein